ncbi:Tim44 domain-containing protein [Candidatus Dojkabacteria bacterium]|nr:Tim44 domain-containing protein [Candidatus Dojkabacteria bacterium]
MNKNLKKGVLLMSLGILVFMTSFLFVSQSYQIHASTDSNTAQSTDIVQAQSKENQEDLQARAGGGEDFGDGGFDSGGGSGDSGSSSGSTWVDVGSTSGGGSGADLPVCCSVPLFIVIVIVVIIYFIMKSRNTNPASSTSFGQSFSTTPTAPVGSGGASATNKSMTSEEIEAQLKKLKELDPDFNEQKFKTHAKKVFMAVQEGWTKQDQKVCRPFMTEDVYQSHEMQIQNMKGAKVINVLENIVVGSVDFAKIDLDDKTHKITMKVRASMKDYKVSAEDPSKIISGTKQQTPPFTEYWVFMRKATLKTKAKDGIFDRKCPNCGAPIDVDVAGTCKYCDANVVNGDYDWVLSEIIQKSEWAE